MKQLLQSEFALLDFLSASRRSVLDLILQLVFILCIGHKSKDIKSVWEERFEVHLVISLNLCAGLSPQQYHCKQDDLQKIAPKCFHKDMLGNQQSGGVVYTEDIPVYCHCK